MFFLFSCQRELLTVPLRIHFSKRFLRSVLIDPNPRDYPLEIGGGAAEGRPPFEHRADKRRRLPVEQRSNAPCYFPPQKETSPNMNIF